MQRTTILICIAAVVAAAAIYGMWVLLGWYIAPESPTHRKDHVQVMAVGLGAVGAIITAIIGWRNLRQSQRSSDRTIENTRLIEQDRAQNDALQKYLEQMGQLLTKEKLRSSEEGTDVRTLARSQTLTVLQGLGPGRKRILLGFLYESHLITGDARIVSLSGADLTGADLAGALLEGANLNWANLDGANLNRANLGNANLNFAKLNGANLNTTRLFEADLTGAYLEEASLEGASLIGASLNGAILAGANLNGANLAGANLAGASLNGANLNGAYLKGANLTGAYLTGANLAGAYLEGANLTEARVTQEQLDECLSLTGATMPDGSKFD